MKFFWKYIFPALFGLLIYATMRVINDTISEFRFWKRDWTISTIEISFSIGCGYLLNYALRRLFTRFDSQLRNNVGYKTVLQELLWVFVICEGIINVVMTPMVALTDDGLSWGDAAAINIIPLLFCIIYYVVVRSNKLLEAYVNNKLQLEKISNDKLQTELKFLRAQYHPHFLFNALNTIYFQMDESVPAAKKSIEQFSELLRYQLYDQQQTVSVSREIEYLKTYIALQKERMNQNLQLHVEFDSSLNGEQVYPLLFMPLVENAFKYAGGEYWIKIKAIKREKEIDFSVENAIPESEHSQKAGGIGLENLQRRLELLYPHSHSFEINRDAHSFKAALKLPV